MNDLNESTQALQSVDEESAKNVIQFMDSKESLELIKKEELTAVPYSKRIGEHLLNVMEMTTQHEVTSQTVSALCKVTSELHKLMKLNLDIRKFEQGLKK